LLMQVCGADATRLATMWSTSIRSRPRAPRPAQLRLSPRDPTVGVFRLNLGEAEVGLGHFDAAIDEFRKALNSGFDRFLPTRTWRPPTRMRARWTRRRRPSPRPAASIPQ
jgi:hypothetical protein